MYSSRADKPSPPQGPLDISDITPETCTLSWKAPFDDGGSPVTNYIVEKLDPAGVSTLFFLSRGTLRRLIHQPYFPVLGEIEQFREEHSLRRDRSRAESPVQLPSSRGESVRYIGTVASGRADYGQIPVHRSRPTWTATRHRLGHLERDPGVDPADIRRWIPRPGRE